MVGPLGTKRVNHMKTGLSLLLLAVALCGCGDSKRVSELNQRVVKLEDSVHAWELVAAEQTRFNKTTMETLRRLVASSAEMQTNLAGFDSGLETIHAKLKEVINQVVSNRPPVNSISARSPQATRTIQPIGLKSGVPAAIYDKIAADAAREWPGDFSMQKYTIGRQVEAYQKINPR